MAAIMLVPGGRPVEALAALGRISSSASLAATARLAQKLQACDHSNAMYGPHLLLLLDIATELTMSLHQMSFPFSFVHMALGSYAMLLMGCQQTRAGTSGFQSSISIHHCHGVICKSCVMTVLLVASWPHIMRVRSTPKVLTKCMLRYSRIS